MQSTLHTFATASNIMNSRVSQMEEETEWFMIEPMLLTNIHTQEKKLVTRSLTATIDEHTSIIFSTKRGL